MKGQSDNEKLSRIWELVSVEPLSGGMSGLGEEMKRLDMRNESHLIFEGGGQSDTISYKVIDKEIRLYDKEGNPLGDDLVWKIERLTLDEFDLLFLAGDDKQKLVRLKYRAKG